jgi:hypothetical protein
METVCNDFENSSVGFGGMSAAFGASTRNEDREWL